MATTTSSILSLSAAAAVPPITPLFPEDDSLLLISGRRPSLQVLNIAANAIPRVIGRAGANVNMIREATGAHVEVEKQSLRKEQAHRKITIKGSPEAVKWVFSCSENWYSTIFMDIHLQKRGSHG
jgi:hypothetical protein